MVTPLEVDGLELIQSKWNSDHRRKFLGTTYDESYGFVHGKVVPMNAYDGISLLHLFCPVNFIAKNYRKKMILFRVQTSNVGNQNLGLIFFNKELNMIC